MTDENKLQVETEKLSSEQLEHLLDRIEKINLQSTAAIPRRDWFAGKALVGLLSTLHTGSAEEVAKEAYILADAMMAQSKL